MSKFLGNTKSKNMSHGGQTVHDNAWGVDPTRWKKVTLPRIKAAQKEDKESKKVKVERADKFGKDR